MKKTLRFLLIGVALVATLLVIVLVLAFQSSVQTWAARRALAGQKDMKADIGRVSAGPKLIELTDIKIEKPGFSLTLPSLTIEMPLASAAQKNVRVNRLVAKGWKVVLSVPTPDQIAQARSAQTSRQGQSSPASQAPQQSPVFDGIFKLLNLPVDFSLGEVDVEGEIIFPVEPGRPPGRAAVHLTGGNLGAGSAGRFALVAKAVIGDQAAPVSDVELKSAVVVQMDTPRTFQKISVVNDLKVVGVKFPQGANLHSELVLNGEGAGEAYLISLQTPSATGAKSLFALDATYPGGAATMSGKWKLDLSNADIAPFMLGLRLPVFVATGEGVFEADRAFSAIHASGRIDNTIEQLSVIKPELAALGRVRTQLDFDLAKEGDDFRVERFSAGISGAKPIISIQALQKFSYNFGTRALKVPDASVELLRLTLHGLPLAWAQPFLKNVSVSGDDVRGEFFVSASNSGFSVRPSAPITITNLSVSQDGSALVQALDIALKLSADSTRQGWQADVSEFSVRSGAATLFTATAKAGQPAGGSQPFKATGRWEVNLPTVLAQPVAARYAILSQGVASGEFTANLDGTKQVYATCDVSKLVSPKVENLPQVKASLRLDLQSDGRIDAQLPVTLQVAGRKSDLELTAHVKPGTTTHIEADVLSNFLYVQDLLPLQGLVDAAGPAGESQAKPVSKPVKPAVAASQPATDKVPFWSACTGQVKLALKEIVYSPEVKVTNVAGILKIDEGAITLENIRAGLGEGSEAALSGKMTFDVAQRDPYRFNGDATVTGFDPAPFFRQANPQKEPTVEGKFDIASKLSGEAPSTALLASKIKADLRLTSRGGVFRGLALPKAFSDRTQGKTGLLSAAAGVVGSLAGGSKGANVAATAAEITTLLVAIPYDQLNVKISHDGTASLTTMEDFTLISPSIRLTGNGSILQQEGVPLMKQPLTAELELSAHGHAADVFGKQGMLQSGTDALGYSPFFAPIKISGTMSEIGTDALVNLLVQKLLTSATGPLGNLFGK